MDSDAVNTDDDDSDDSDGRTSGTMEHTQQYHNRGTNRPQPRHLEALLTDLTTAITVSTSALGPATSVLSLRRMKLAGLA